MIPRWVFSTVAGLAIVGVIFGATNYRELLQERDARWNSEKFASELLADRVQVTREREASYEILAKVADPQVKMFELSAVGGEKGMGRILWDRTGRSWTLLAKDLNALPPGEVYEMWFVSGRTKTSAGRFRPDSSGIIRHTVALPAGLESIDAAVITREPVDDADPANPSEALVIAGKTP